MSSFLFPSYGFLANLLDESSSNGGEIVNAYTSLLQGSVAWWEMVEETNEIRQSTALPNIPLYPRNEPSLENTSLLNDGSVGPFVYEELLYHSKDSPSSQISVLEFPEDIFYCSFWMYSRDRDRFSTILGVYDRTSNANRVWGVLTLGDGRVLVQVSDDGLSYSENQLITDEAVTDIYFNQWTLIEVYFNAGELGIAINNGDFKTLNTTATSLYRNANSGSNNTPFMIGGSSEGGTSKRDGFPSYLDQVILLNKLPTSEERDIIWNMGNAILYTKVLAESINDDAFANNENLLYVRPDTENLYVRPNQSNFYIQSS